MGFRRFPEQLGLADIISNPSSITYGRKSNSDLYQFFYKMVRLFQPKAGARRISIRISGSIYDKVAFYNSFQLVPLVLLDNAVKYADPGTEILIKYESRGDGLYVDFDSIGPLVPSHSAEDIFLRGFRGENAVGKCVGSGLGLHIASEIIKAHGFHLSYEGHPNKNGCDSGTNSFTLFIDNKHLN
jgi:signal transduction histidine kinase